MSLLLFQVTVGREWYMHAIYTVKATDQRRKRSVIHTYHSLIHSSSGRSKRAVSGAADKIGKDYQRGTQMKYLKLEKRERKSTPPAFDSNDPGNGITSQEPKFSILYVVIGAAIVVLLITIIIVALFLKRRSKNSPQDDAKGQYTSGKNIVVTRKPGGGTTSSAVSKRSSSGYSSSDTSEV